MRVCGEILHQQPNLELPSAHFELGFNKVLVQDEEVEEKCH